MTAADLSGRDLDVAVARALGWEWVDVPPDYHGHHSGRVLVRSASGFLASGADFPKVGKLVESFYVPRYSTDPATLDEKLEWLRQNASDVLAMLSSSGKGVELSTDDYDDYGFRGIVARGKDIHEATARLVVAVKEAMP